MDKDETVDQAPPVLTPIKNIHPPVSHHYADKEIQQSVLVSNLLLEHAREVEKRLLCIANALTSRAFNHDRSKFDVEEYSTFVEEAPKLGDLTYNSKEYKAALERMRPALKLHYEKNRHHPEHFENSIRGMNLIDIVEMFCDWCASVHRQKDGNLRESIAVNQNRFNISDDLTQIFLNTSEFFEEFGL